MDLGQDFRDLLELFNKAGVKYLVAGGYESDRACAEIELRRERRTMGIVASKKMVPLSPQARSST
jgi:hypothetical protein